ncbi:MAG TPA: hypothetical protein VE621_15565 [Bryobacteraceae bacterium]|jgi:hypothetical protein|nr:hypothetical protein [Bryobacteraceae bacterium]
MNNPNDLQVPPNVLDAVQRGIEELLKQSDPRYGRLQSPTFGLRVFTLSLDDLEASPIPFCRAQEVGWVVVADDHDAPVAAEVLTNRIARMTGLSQGTRLRELIDAITQARNLPGIQVPDLKLRALRVPGVLTDSLWFKAANDVEDRFVPLRTLERSLNRIHIYQAEEFARLLVAIAKDFRQLDLVKESKRCFNRF